nr:hypothetical protein [Nocardia mangyaensis]
MPQLTSRLRGGGCGVLVGGLAIAAHGIAGGGVPRSAEITLLLLVSVGAGILATRGDAGAAGLGRTLTTSAHAAAQRRSGSAPLVKRARELPGRAARACAAAPAVRTTTALLGGQWAGHHALTGTLEHHGGVVDVLHLPSASMAVAHVLAAIICAALILVAERLYLVASSVVRAALSAPSATLFRPTARWSIALAAHGARPKGARCPRAPPLFA